MTQNTSDGREPTDETTGNEPRSITVAQVIEAPPERVYDAFLDPDDLSEWIAPNGFSAEVQELQPEEGGTFRIANEAQTEEMKQYNHTFRGTYQELKPGERIVFTDESNVNDSGEGDVGTGTVSFEAVPHGTEVTLRIDGIPDYVPLEGASDRWGDSLEELAERLKD